MIESVEIWNFQSHKHTVLDFVPGTNVIIGLSDAGKSAVFRAIDWALSNRPLGDAYRSEWGGDTHVILRLSDGDVVERFRSASSNEYRVNGETLKAFGSDPPEAVLEVLRMDSANIQAQGAPPFLLSASPGEAARMLNKAASLDEIDKTIANLRKSLQETNRQLEYNTKQKEGLEEELKEYANLAYLEERVLELESIEDEYQERKSSTESLSKIVSNVRKVSEDLSKLDHVPALIKRCKDVDELHERLEIVTDGANTLEGIIRQVEVAERDLEKTDKVPELLEELDAITDQHQDYKGRKSRLLTLMRTVRRIKTAQASLDKVQVLETAEAADGFVETALTRHREVLASVNRMNRLVSRAQELVSRLGKVESSLEELEQEYHEIAPEICPLCGGEVKKLKKEEK